jgi:FkbM family methyltransferase
VVFAGRLLRPTDSLGDKTNFTCVDRTILDVRFPICTFDANEDIYISRKILKENGYYETDKVSKIINLIRKYNFQLVDIGANIGVYLLPAARVTKVVAVEPYWRSMARLAKSVYIGDMASNVSLVYNAISNTRIPMQLGISAENQGNTFLLQQNSTDCPKTPDGSKCFIGPQVHSIFLDDLLPLMDRRMPALLKVDVESHEVYVFTDSTASKFFKAINVVMVQMEWRHCRNRPAHEVHALVEFFRSRGYAVFSADSQVRLDSRYMAWPLDVIFAKESFGF